MAEEPKGQNVKCKFDNLDSVFLLRLARPCCYAPASFFVVVPTSLSFIEDGSNAFGCEQFVLSCPAANLARALAAWILPCAGSTAISH